MTQQDKDLLLRDLCARLPYSIIGYMEIDLGSDEIHNYGYLKLDVELLSIDKDEESIRVIATNTATEGQSETLDYMQDDDLFKIEDIKTYLRPLSSLTQEERNKFCDIGGVISHRPTDGKQYIVAFVPEALDYLNSIHADYRGLIEKGLAIEVTDENNPYK